MQTILETFKWWTAQQFLRLRLPAKNGKILSGASMTTRVKKLLKELKEGLNRIYGNRLMGLYLYGSYARGDNRPGSDVDVMIVLSDYKDYMEELLRSGDLASDLSLAYDVTVSRVIMKESQWENSDTPLLRNIRKEGIAA